MPINPVTGLEEEEPIQQRVMDSIARKYGYPQGLGDEDLVAAQEQARNSRLYAGLGEAFSGLGRSIAGATTPQDTSFYKGMAESADQPVQDILARRKGLKDQADFQELQALQDPNSVQSQVAQRIGGKMGYDLSGLPMSQVKNITPMLAAEESAKSREAALKAMGMRQQIAQQEKKDAAKEKAAIVSDKQVESINDFDTAIANAEELLSSYKSGYTGPVNQYKGSSIGKLVSSPESVTYQSKIGRNSDVYRRLITGAAAADKELARIESRLPQANDPEDVFKSKALDYINEVKKSKDRYLKNLERKGKNVVEFKQPEVGAVQGSVNSSAKVISKKLFSPSRNQTKLIYSDGSEEVVSGRQ